MCVCVSVSVCVCMCVCVPCGGINTKFYIYIGFQDKKEKRGACVFEGSIMREKKERKEKEKEKRGEEENSRGKACLHLVFIN